MHRACSKIRRSVQSPASLRHRPGESLCVTMRLFARGLATVSALLKVYSCSLSNATTTTHTKLPAHPRPHPRPDLTSFPWPLAHAAFLHEDDASIFAELFAEALADSNALSEVIVERRLLRRVHLHQRGRLLECAATIVLVVTDGASWFGARFVPLVADFAAPLAVATPRRRHQARRARWPIAWNAGA